MHQSTFPFGDLEIVALTAQSICSENYYTKLITMQEFAAHVRDLSSHRLPELSGLFAASKGQLYFLNAHGNHKDGQWVIKDKWEESRPICDILNGYPALAWLILACNPEGHRIEPAQPCLYSLDTIYTPSQIFWDGRARSFHPPTNRDYRFVLWGTTPRTDARIEELQEPLLQLDALIKEEDIIVQNSPDALPF